MRGLAIALLLLWQAGSGGPESAPSPSRHLRYQREIVLAARSSGQSCVALDGAVFAHTESAGAGDIRIYGDDGSREFEVPFALTESGPATLEPQSATVGDAVVREGTLGFDLSMPGGDYSEIDLDLKAKNFVGAAQVAGVDPEGHTKPLGTFAIFDLSAKGLARSTVLSLPESSYPVLRVAIRMVTPEGQPTVPSARMIAGATVPPVGQEQTVYTAVASSGSIERQGQWSVATMMVPQHVPIERARVVLRPEFHADFLRDVTLAATPLEKGWEATGAAEGVSGHIFRVTRSAMDGIPAIDSQVLAINTVVGANLRSAAKITVSVDNGSAAPLPIERVELEMRERTLCFEARPGISYVLRYGDAELSAPSYGYAQRFAAAVKPLVAVLGTERRNPDYVPHGTGDEQQRPGHELPWLLLIAGVSVAGVIALQYVRHIREGSG